ncbi:MAG TPA: hypothetical protein VLF93_06595 [Candidatus Saccharimonadales bacterium]|nr:hypothetical protein [Candidatus Saccharimonadales bacterium]
MKEVDKKPIVIFDIDFTIFDTAQLRHNRYKIFSKRLGYDDFNEFLTIARETEEETKEKEKHFVPRVFLSLLKKKAKSDISLEEMESIFFDEEFYEKSLYSDVLDVFDELITKRHVGVALLSTGEKEFQYYKIRALQKYLNNEHIHIFRDKVPELKKILSKYKDNTVFLVDDMLHVLKEAKKVDPNVMTIWIKRKREFNDSIFFDDQVIDDFIPDNVISDLHELLPLLPL